MNQDQTNSRDYILSNKLYNVLKPFTTIVLPAIGTLYFALASIWGFPYAEEVIGSIAAVATFLGVVLGLSSKSYNNSQAKYDGVMNILETDDKKTYSLDLNVDPDELDQKKEIIFKLQ